MPTRYVWWDDKRADPPTRMELRPPKSLHGFVHDLATRNGVSVNAFVVALLQWAVTADDARKLRVEVGPSRVTLTAEKPEALPVSLAEQTPSTDRRFRYGKRKVR